MKIYLGITGKKVVHNFAKKYDCGWCLTPDNYRQVPHGSYFLDNGAFAAYKNETPYDPSRFFKLIEKYPTHDFVVVPDIVAGGMKSLEYSLSFIDVIKRPRYLAVQDYMYSQQVREYLHLFDGVFVGGTIPWKMQNIKMWVDIAKLHGIKCHVGRIGSLDGYLICNALGVDSVDGTYPSRNGDVRPIRAFAEQANFNEYDWFDIGPADYRWKNLCESV